MWLHETRLSPGQTHTFAEPPSPRLPQTHIALLGAQTVARLAPGSLGVVLVLRGSVLVQCGDARLKLGRRSWMVCEADARPIVQMEGRGRAMVLGFSPAALKLILPPNGPRLLPGNGRLDTDSWRLLAAGLREAGEPTSAFWRREPILRAVCRRVLALQLDLHERIAACPGKSQARRSQVLTRLQRARLYLEANSDRVVRIAELADIANFSHWYFTRTFHRVYGMSPKTYATRLRLDRARRLLNNREVAIGEVAAACGFENASAFSRAFKQHFGRSASDCRRTRADTQAVRA